MSRVEQTSSSPCGQNSPPEEAVCVPKGPVCENTEPSRTAANDNHVRAYCEDNHFNIPGPRADPSVAGDALTQIAQSGWTLAQTAAALSSKAGVSPDGALTSVLGTLDRNPPLTSSKIEHAEYTSDLPKTAPSAAFEYFVKHPTELFAAAGIKLEPPTKELTQGARLFLEEPGVTPPVFAPIEVELIPEENRVRIHTLDGHPLRGTNEFTFESDGAGGTRMHQLSDFQQSSFAVAGGGLVMAKFGADPIDRQHEIWRAVHAHVADNAR